MKETKISVCFAAGMFGASSSDTVLDSILRNIAEQCGDSNDWCEKYGTDFENDIFSMHRFCWCEKENCPYCWDEEKHGKQHANFIHKPTDFKVWWYKYIGRSVEKSKEIEAEELIRIGNDCLNSLKKEAHPCAKRPPQDTAEAGSTCV